MLNLVEFCLISGVFVVYAPPHPHALPRKCACRFVISQARQIVLSDMQLPRDVLPVADGHPLQLTGNESDWPSLCSDGKMVFPIRIELEWLLELDQRRKLYFLFWVALSSDARYWWASICVERERFVPTDAERQWKLRLFMGSPCSHRVRWSLWLRRIDCSRV